MNVCVTSSSRIAIALATAIVLALSSVQISRAQTCITQNMVGFDDSGNLLTLFNMTTPKMCCAGCASFEECIGYAWVNQINGSLIPTGPQCTLYNSNSRKQLTATPSIGGSYHTTFKRYTSCSSSSDTFYNGPVIKNITVTSLTGDCCTLCSAFAGCNYWVFNGTTCYFLTGQGQSSFITGLTSGTVIPNSVMRTPLRSPTKRGLGLFGTNSCSDLRLLSANVSWIHNWDTQPGLLEECMAELGFEFVPTIALYYSNATQFEEYVNSTYTRAQYLLTFPSPNVATTTNISVAEAVAAWPIIQRFADQYGMKIGMPSASFPGTIQPILWLSAFKTACPSCRVDFVVTNYFTCQTSQLTSTLSGFNTFAARYNISLWLTSVTCIGATVEDELAFMSQALPLLDDFPNLDRYAWYGTRQGVNNYNLFNYTTCGLTAIGELYAGGTDINSTVTTTLSAASTGGTTRFQLVSSAGCAKPLLSLLFLVLISHHLWQC